jgi:hypothetical protein
MAVHCFFVPAGAVLSDLPGLTPPEARALVNDLRAWPDAHAGRILPLVAAEAKLLWAWPSLADAARASLAGDERFRALSGAWELVVAEALVAMADPRFVRPVAGAVAPRLLDPGGAGEHARAIYGGPAHLVARPGPVCARISAAALAAGTDEGPRPGEPVSETLAAWLDADVLSALTTGRPWPRRA